MKYIQIWIKKIFLTTFFLLVGCNGYNQMDKISSEIKDLNVKVNQVDKDVISKKTDIDSIKTDIKFIKVDMKSIKTDVDAIKNEVGGVQVESKRANQRLDNQIINYKK